MRRLFKNEWKRAVNGIYFKLTVIVGILLAVLSSVESFRTHILWQLNTGVLGAENVYPNTITEVWIGMDISTMYNSLFMILFPILAALPYAMVSFEDRESGYIGQILIRESRKAFYPVRYLVAFLTGGIGVSIPLVLNLMLGALYAPIMPQSPAEYQTYIDGMSFASELFFISPLGYIAIFLVIDFLWGGLFAVVALSMTDVVKNKYIIPAFPFLLHMVVFYLSSYSRELVIMDVGDFVPYCFLNPMQSHDFAPLPFGLTSLLTFMVTFGVIVRRNVARDIL